MAENLMSDFFFFVESSWMLNTVRHLHPCLNRLSYPESYNGNYSQTQCIYPVENKSKTFSLTCVWKYIAGQCGFISVHYLSWMFHYIHLAFLIL